VGRDIKHNTFCTGDEDSRLGGGPWEDLGFQWGGAHLRTHSSWEESLFVVRSDTS